ncbi:MAG: MarR family winged helix-turn-helix transcriptional regulator [Motilibacteraceae bacterium]
MDGASSTPTEPGRRGRRRDTGRRRIPRDELAVWRGWLRAHALVVRRLEADLLREQELPLASYDVLVQLVEAPDRRLRMTELADAVLISRSGLTRLVDRLESEGLVRREPCVDDARGLNAVLTDAGYERLRQASSTHLRGVDDYVLSRLSTEELGQLDAILAKLLAPLPPGTPTSP